jgi:sulfur carrier protein ThiS
MANFFLPQSMRPAVGRHPLELPAPATLGQALAQLAEQQPDMVSRFWREQRLLPGFFLFKNQQLLPAGHAADCALAAGDQVRLVQPLSGG